MAGKAKTAKRVAKPVQKKATKDLKAAAKEMTKVNKAPQKKAAPAIAKRPAPVALRPVSAPAAASEKPAYTNVFKLPGFNFKEMENVMTKPNFQFDQLASEAANSSREGMEAFIKFSTILAKGCEDIIRTAASLTQGSAEKQAEFAKQMMGAKTLNEFTAAQNKIAQASFDQFMANATKISEMSIKVLNESIAPLSDQMAKGLNKTMKKAA